MKELALHILDLVQNSISANADFIKIIVNEDIHNDLLTIILEDNGCGMDEEQTQRAKDPFVTSRSSRKVGLGIPFMLAACQRCEGDLILESQKNVGTKLTATFKYSHIDRMPMGSMTDTMASLVMTGSNIDFLYIHRINQAEFCFDTREIRQTLGEGIPLTEPDVLDWIKGYIDEGLSNLRGGVL